MRSVKAVSLSFAEAKFLLAKCYAEIILDDPESLADQLLAGPLQIPNLATANNQEIFSLFCQFNLGEKVAEENNAALVFILDVLVYHTPKWHNSLPKAVCTTTTHNSLDQELDGA